MTIKGFLRITGCLVLAAGVTLNIYLVDARQWTLYQSTNAHRWARQITAQAEGLAVAARQRGEEDPIGWAVGFLTQGNEPRIVKVRKVHLEENEGGGATQIRTEAQSFFYTKLLTPEDNTAIQVEVAMDYVGFLGAKTRLANDFLVLISFIFCFSFFVLVTRTRSRDNSGLKNLILAWVGEARGLLTQLGISIREMVREAQNLTIAAGKSRDAVSDLRERIHAGINHLHDGRKALKEADQAAEVAEVVALNLMLEVAKSGTVSSEAAETLHRLVQKMRKLNQQSTGMVNRIESELEPLATDADIAFHAFDELFKSTSGMDGYIRKTTETLLGQAKLIQNLNSELATEKNPVVTAEPVQSVKKPRVRTNVSKLRQ